MTVNQRNNKFYREESGYIIRYAGSGVVNTIVGLLVIFLAMASGIPPVISNISGYAVGFILSFVLSKKFVFRSEGHFVTESLLYLYAFAVAFLFNLLVLNIELYYFNVNAVLAQLIAAASYTLLMYLLVRMFVFNRAKCSSGAQE